MKKIITLLLITLCLVACGTKQETNVEENIDQTYKIVSPSGAPALSLLDLADDEKIELDIVDGTDVLQAEFVDNKADIIIAPVNLGVKLANQTLNYELKSVITWGNLHLVSTNKDFKQGKVASFGEMAVPGKVLGSLDLNDFEFEWFNAANEVSAALLAGQYEAAVLAEPYLTMTKSKAETEIYEIADIQELYKEKTGLASYPQAAIFVNKNNEVSYDELLEKIKTSIETYNKDNEQLAKRIDEVDMEKLGFANGELIKKAYSRMALNYVKLTDCVDEVNAFLQLFGIEGIVVE